MKIKVGDYDVIDSGSIVANENEPIDFFIVEEIGFIIRIEFETNTESPEPSVKVESFDKAGARLIFNNFQNSLGVGNIIPMTIGKLKGKELLINYRVYSLEKGGKTFHYTWLLGKEVKNAN